MKYRQGFFLFFQRIQKNNNSLISLKPFSHIDVKDDIISLWKRVLYILSVCHSLKIKRILSYSFHIKQWDNKNWQITVNMRVKERRERERERERETSMWEFTFLKYEPSIQQRSGRSTYHRFRVMSNTIRCVFWAYLNVFVLKKNINCSFMMYMWYWFPLKKLTTSYYSKGRQKQIFPA